MTLCPGSVLYDFSTIHEKLQSTTEPRPK